MSSWYDWVPGAANVAGVAKGDWAEAGLGPVATLGKAADNKFFQGPANEAKAGFDRASGMTQQNLQQLMQYIGGQQDQALGYYKPLQSMFNNAYGTQGIDAPVTPRAPGAK